MVANAETDPGLRTLSSFRRQFRSVDDDGALYDRMGDWDHDGSFGWLFSGEGVDTLSFDNPVTGFDLTEIFDTSAVRTAMMSARCAGVKEGFPNTENIQVNGRDVSAVTSSLQAKLSQDKSIDYIVTLGAPIALAALQSIDQSGSAAKLVTFDLNTDAAQAIKDGKIEFSIDQQPYVQGYMAVTSLYLYLKNGNDIGGGKAVLTGPSFVDKSNIDVILPFAQNNTR